ncbi:MFS transporter [Actinoallomurus sp. CA-142502]|uniref:MFS transporter n=1 Tax=Actinoallomurus sp. CA-142502 TaxID=3239885 RepID=UPI003D93B3F9
MNSLRRNRDFLLLQVGQLLSSAGGQAAAVAYPLVVLAVTHSPALAGVVSFARMVPSVLFGPLSGVLSDRVNRKALMIISDAFRAVAVGSIALTLGLNVLPYWQIPIVAFVEGAFSSVFNPAAAGMLRSIVPVEDLSSAVATQQARSSVAQLGGPPAGGALYAASRAFPFLIDAASYFFSMVAVILLRTRSSHVTSERDGRWRLRTDLAEGWRFLWTQPFLRTTTFLYGLTNPIGPGILLALVVVSQQEELPSTIIGALLATFSGCLLIGSLLSGVVRRRLSPRAIMLLELLAWPGPLLFTLWPNAYVLAASILPVALAIPATDSVVVAQRLAATPDRLVGRVESVRSTIALVLAPFGSLAAGVLLDAMSARPAILIFALPTVPLAIWGLLSPALRNLAVHRVEHRTGVGQAVPDDRG